MNLKYLMWDCTALGVVGSVVIDPWLTFLTGMVAGVALAVGPVLWYNR